MEIMCIASYRAHRTGPTEIVKLIKCITAKRLFAEHLDTSGNYPEELHLAKSPLLHHVLDRYIGDVAMVNAENLVEAIGVERRGPKRQEFITWNTCSVPRI